MLVCVSKAILARLKFLSAGEGGRLTVPRPGFHPQLKLGSAFTSCVVQPASDGVGFDFEQVHDVLLHVTFWDQYQPVFAADDPIELYEGSKCVARGAFVRIVS
jgi:hypothetical protein